MMHTAQAIRRSTERRRYQRVPVRAPALIGGRRFRLQRSENAVIEEIGRGGIRIRSGASLKRGDAVTLCNERGDVQYSARVVWTRRQGLIEKRSTGRVGQAVIAGCRLRVARKDSEKGRARSARPVGERGRAATVVLGRFLLVTSGLFLTGLIGYFLSSLMSLW